MYIAVDFDGTCVTHEYPKIGVDIEGCIDTLKWLNSIGHKIILYTMRSGKQLQEAINYLENKGIILFGINDNPTQSSWTSSRKVYAHYYIDDAAIGVPLLYNKDICDKPWVNWILIRDILNDKFKNEPIKILPKEKE